MNSVDSLLPSVPSLSYIISVPLMRSPLFPYTTLFRSLMPVRRRRRRQPTPGDLPRETQAVEPQRVVFAEPGRKRSEEHTSELQSRRDLVCRLLLEKKKTEIR